MGSIHWTSDLVSENEAALSQELCAFRAYLHQHPELSEKEVGTTALLRERLAALELEVPDFGLQTGVIAVLRGGLPGPTVALRADIDALPAAEPSEEDNASPAAPAMHACGHDFHTTALLGCATMLARRRAELTGSVIFVFQPAEESMTGAKQVLASGALQALGAQAIFALHVWPEIPFGRIGIRKGPIMAARDEFSITVHGQGGHGSLPHQTHDPIPAGSALVLALQTIVSRNLSLREQAVVSVCSVHAGSCASVIPDSYTILGSTRTFSSEVRRLVFRRINEIARATAEAYGCTAAVTEAPGVPVLVNNGALYPYAAASASRLFGPDGLFAPEPVAGSEDFAYFCGTLPACFALFGVGLENEPVIPLHNSHFYPTDSALLPAAAFLADTALRYLQGGNN